MSVVQTLSTLKMHLMTPESESWLIAERISPSPNGIGYQVAAVYTNRPHTHLRGARSEMHLGGLLLDSHGPANYPDTLAGEYWTDRKTRSKPSRVEELGDAGSRRNGGCGGARGGARQGAPGPGVDQGRPPGPAAIAERPPRPRAARRSAGRRPRARRAPQAPAPRRADGVVTVAVATAVLPAGVETEESRRRGTGAGLHVEPDAHRPLGGAQARRAALGQRV